MTIAAKGFALKVACAITIGFGMVIAMAAYPPAAGLAAFFADLLFWPIDGAPRLDSSAARLLAAIAGGVLVGWGVTLWYVVEHVLPKDHAAVGAIIRAGLLSWFAIDSLASIAAGAPLNAIANVGFVAAFLLPLRKNVGTPDRP